MRLAAGLCFVMLLCARGDAVEQVALQIAQWQQAGITARGIEVHWKLSDTPGPAAMVRIEEIRLPRVGAFRNVVIECARPIARDFTYRCDDARVSAGSQLLGPQKIGASVSWNQHSRELLFHATGVSLANGKLTAQGRWSVHHWAATVEGAGLAVASLRKLLAAQLPPLPGWSIEGNIASISATASGAQGIDRLEATLDIGSLAIGNADGSIATDQLAARGRLQAARVPKAWSVDAELSSSQGEALAGRWYWNFTQQPLASNWRGTWRDDGVLVLDSSHWKLGTFLSAGVTGEISTAGPPLLRALDVSLEALDAASLPPQTRDGLLAGSPVAQLQGSGKLSGRLQIENDAPALADLTLDGITLHDTSAKLGVDGLSGKVRWHSLERRKQVLAEDGADTRSELSWRAGQLYGVGIGAAALRFTTASSDWRLTEATRIPILDGALAVRVLQLRRIGDPAMSIRFDASIDPIGLAPLSKAFGWPEFAGTLSGRIPDLTLEAGVLTLGGALQAAVFNGNLTVKDLQLSDALGTRPRLTANVGFTRLDLAAITSAFSVGRITGRIDGRIDGLELVGWEPIAFDAHLYSTPGDHSRRRISQRAVQNISSIGGGGGAAAALQRSALRFFNEFNYAKLGISCRLQNDVCDMDGVEEHTPGYYLVKGWGLPRIDVIGNSRRVDWQRLVTTLKELPESKASIGESP